MIAIIDNFPVQIKAMASWISLCDEGPFPLDHDDFLHSNIMVDENSFNVTGLIDWEGACTINSLGADRVPRFPWNYAPFF